MTTNNSPGKMLSKVFRIFAYLLAVAVAVELVIGLVLLNDAWGRRDTWNREQRLKQIAWLRLALLLPLLSDRE